MTDKNGKTIRTGDVVRVSGGYFKNSNGLFYVSRGQDAPGCENYKDIWLHKISKKGEISESGAASQSWPLTSYCSDSRKNREAAEHNRQNARIELVNTVPRWDIAEHFEKEAEQAEERAENQRRMGWPDAEKTEANARFYRTVAAKCKENGGEAPEKKEPEQGIKFYYNGLRLDGAKKLIPCYYYIDRDTQDSEIKGVSINAADYGAELPKKYLPVKNDTDIMTDSFDKDSAYLTPEHPLYKYALYVALKGVMWGKTYRKPTEKQIELWNTLKDPGQPTAADYEAIEQHRKNAAERKREAEEAEQRERTEKIKRQTEEGRQYIEQIKEQYPAKDGQPIVTIQWSEHPVFYSWDDGELKLSVAAAEEIFKHYDTKETKGEGGYYKTSFKIEYTMPDEAEQSTYEGRYDLGDLDGGLIKHIRNFASFQNSAEVSEQISEFADYLESFTAGGRIVNIEVAPYVTELMEQRKKDIEDFMNFMLSLLTVDDLKNLIRLNSKDPVALKVYMTKLFQKDPKAAMEMQKEINGAE